MSKPRFLQRPCFQCHICQTQFIAEEEVCPECGSSLISFIESDLIEVEKYKQAVKLYKEKKGWKCRICGWHEQEREDSCLFCKAVDSFIPVNGKYKCTVCEYISDEYLECCPRCNDPYSELILISESKEGVIISNLNTVAWKKDGILEDLPASIRRDAERAYVPGLTDIDLAKLKVPRKGIFKDEIHPVLRRCIHICLDCQQLMLGYRTECPNCKTGLVVLADSQILHEFFGPEGFSILTQLKEAYANKYKSKNSQRRRERQHCLCSSSYQTPAQI